MLFLCFSFHFTPMPHALLTLFTSVQCMAMFFFTSLPFCHRHAVALWFTSFPFHGYAWCMPLPHATRYRNILEHSLVDLIQTCTYICSSIKGCKCQPENSSLVLLVFPLLSQRDYLHNWLLVPSVCPPFSLQFPRVPVDAETFWVVSSTPDLSNPPPIEIARTSIAQGQEGSVILVETY